MKNLLRVQLYRFSRHPLTRYVLLPANILTALLPLGFYHLLFDTTEHITNAEGHTIQVYSFGGWDASIAFRDFYLVSYCILILIPLTYSVCSAFHSKTVLHELIGGYSIHQLLLSRLIVAAGIPFLLSLLSVGLPVAAVTWLRGWNNSCFYSPRETASCILLTVFLLLQVNILCVLSCCIAREASTSLAITWMLYLLSFLFVVFTLSIFLEPVLLSVMSKNVFVKMQQLFASILPGMPLLLLFQYDPFSHGAILMPISPHLPAVLIAGVFWIILFYLIAYLRLKYSEVQEEI